MYWSGAVEHGVKVNSKTNGAKSPIGSQLGSNWELGNVPYAGDQHFALRHWSADVPVSSCTPLGPMTPMEVLLVLPVGLSCGCNRWWIPNHLQGDTYGTDAPHLREGPIMLAARQLRREKLEGGASQQELKQRACDSAQRKGSPFRTNADRIPLRPTVSRPSRVSLCYTLALDASEDVRCVIKQTKDCHALIVHSTVHWSAGWPLLKPGSCPAGHMFDLVIWPSGKKTLAGEASAELGSKLSGTGPDWSLTAFDSLHFY
ncbi:hypothetical protein EDB84DRAFT_1437367 [Lactarius hengduanensis]|nr:hypothetical protein EDB84DRAFT_1437367 [Lactarius hengduanensis]